MNNFSARMPVEDIDNGSGDDFAKHILSVWRRSEGNLTDDYVKAFPKMVLFDGAPRPQDSPDLLVCGNDALSIKILGAGWAESAEQARKFLTSDYRSMVGKDYFDSTNSQLPIFSIVSAQMHDTNGNSLNVLYQRLVLPVRTMGGGQFLLGYSFLPGTMPMVRGSSLADEIPPDRMSETPDYANLFAQGELSIPSPMARND